MQRLLTVFVDFSLFLFPVASFVLSHWFDMAMMMKTTNMKRVTMTVNDNLDDDDPDNDYDNEG